MTRHLLPELERADEAVRKQGDDEWKTHFDPNCHPRAFQGFSDKSEPIADDQGRTRDKMTDTPQMGIELGPSSDDIFLSGMPELRHENLKETDIGTDEELLDLVDLQQSTDQVDIL